MPRTLYEMPWITRPLRWLSRAILKVIGWHVEGRAPDFRKYIIIVAPHTSNWDFPVALLCVFALGLEISFLGKAELFRWPVLGRLFYRLGGIPVQRDKAQDVVASAIGAFHERDRLVLGIAPEGTRKKVAAWKTGFYRIAVGARVPIALAFLDYARKAGGFGPLLQPTGDFVNDMEVIREFYANVTAYRPDQTGPPSVPFRPEDETS